MHVSVCVHSTGPVIELCQTSGWPLNVYIITHTTTYTHTTHTEKYYWMTLQINMLERKSHWWLLLQEICRRIPNENENKKLNRINSARLWKKNHSSITNWCNSFIALNIRELSAIIHQFSFDSILAFPIDITNALRTTAMHSFFAR